MKSKMNIIEQLIVFESISVMHLSKADAGELLKALDRPAQVNSKLLKAAQRYKANYCS